MVVSYQEGLHVCAGVEDSDQASERHIGEEELV